MSCTGFYKRASWWNYVWGCLYKPSVSPLSFREAPWSTCRWHKAELKALWCEQGASSAPASLGHSGTGCAAGMHHAESCREDKILCQNTGRPQNESGNGQIQVEVTPRALAGALRGCMGQAAPSGPSWAPDKPQNKCKMRKILPSALSFVSNSSYNTDTHPNVHSNKLGTCTRW